MACALVDVDGTLVDATSCERLFIRHLICRGLLGPAQIAAAAAFPFRWGARFGRHVWKKNKAYLAGLSVERIVHEAERFTQSRLAPRLRPVMVELVEAHRRRGEPVALLTGTPDFIARPLARMIGAEAVAATECRAEGGRYTVAPPAAHPFAHDKVAFAHDLCARLGSTLGECTAYADSVHDVALLCAAGRAVAVCPDAGLARAARRRGWEIVRG